MTALIAELAEVVSQLRSYDDKSVVGVRLSALSESAVQFIRAHHVELTRILTDDEAIRAAHHDLVIRLGEVTTELEAARKDARGERGETWEVWQEDMPAAVSDSFPDAMRYLAMYQQDGPVTLKRAVVYRETITPEQLAAMKESGK